MENSRFGYLSSPYPMVTNRFNGTKQKIGKKSPAELGKKRYIPLHWVKSDGSRWLQKIETKR